MSTQPTLELRPVSDAERLMNVDVLRGIALLGILLMNIPWFAMPDYYSDSFKTDLKSVNFWCHAFITILFEGKMRALFSMIFGAGILLFTMKKEKSWTVTGLYYRRMLWLVLFGLVDAHILLWFGDILYLYGVCGLIAYLFHKMKPIYLSIGVPLAIIIGFWANTMFFQGVREKLLAYNEAKAVQEKNITLTAPQQKAMADWRDVEKELLPSKEDAVEHTRLMKGNYTEVASYLRPFAFRFQTKYLIYGIWDPLVLMLLGMALFKWGFFSGKWSRKQYLATLLWGYGIGLPLVIYSYWFNFVHFPTHEASLKYMAAHSVNWTGLIYDFQRLLIMFGHASLILLVLKAGWWKGIMARLSAVGRMAFTNYVMHTIICTAIFFGYGLNYFAELQYYQLYFIVAGIWLLQLVVSQVWLTYYLFGPLEWCWRSLTYWKRQPMKRE